MIHRIVRTMFGKRVEIALNERWTLPIRSNRRRKHHERECILPRSVSRLELAVSNHRRRRWYSLSLAGTCVPPPREKDDQLTPSNPNVRPPATRCHQQLHATSTNERMRGRVHEQARCGASHTTKHVPVSEGWRGRATVSGGSKGSASPKGTRCFARYT